MTDYKITKRILFTDFWTELNDNNNIYIPILKERYNIICDSRNPEVVIHSIFGNRHLLYPNALKICICGENCFPDFNVSDYAISSIRGISERNLYIPVGLRYIDDYNKFPIPSISHSDTKREFCSFIYSQDSMGRGAFFRKSFCSEIMMRYKKVACPGRVLNNMTDAILSMRSGSDWHVSKLAFMNKYKFNIAFENSEGDGYITEKLIDCYRANVVPIYWGSMGNVHPFPKDSMILINDYSSFSAAIQKVIEIDNNEELYLQYLSKNPLRQANFFDIKLKIAQFLYRAIDSCDNRFEKWTCPTIYSNVSTIEQQKNANDLTESEISSQVRSRRNERALASFVNTFRILVLPCGILSLYFVEPFIKYAKSVCKRLLSVFSKK